MSELQPGESQTFKDPYAFIVEGPGATLSNGSTDNLYFSKRDYEFTITITRKLPPIPDGSIYALNETFEILFTKKYGDWYSIMNFGHPLATENKDQWTIENHLTDEHVRANYLQVKVT